MDVIQRVICFFTYLEIHSICQDIFERFYLYNAVIDEVQAMKFIANSHKIQSSKQVINNSVSWLILQKWKMLLKSLVVSSEIQVWSTYDRQGNLWWSAYDPVTKRGIYHVSQEQILTWIERRDRH
jgi:hypothetical protein